MANSAEWVCDTKALRHFRANKKIMQDFMQDFNDVTDGECVYLGNPTSARVMGEGKILIKFTYGKLLSLSNALYVHSLCKTLVSGILLNKVGVKTIVGDDKIVISHNGVFVGKGYLNGRLFVLNLASETINENASSSTYIVESVDL